MRWRPQRLREPNSWQAEGFPSELEARYWADRSCGAVCVQAVVSHFTAEEVPLWDIISRGRRNAAYGPNGWIHAALARLLKTYGVRAMAKPMPAEVRRVQRALTDGGVLICSVGLGFPTSGKRSGHLVVAHGFATQPAATVLTMDPSDLGRQFASVGAERFVASFSGRVIECSAGR